jgi:hypothetical protein
MNTELGVKLEKNVEETIVQKFSMLTIYEFYPL